MSAMANPMRAGQFLAALRAEGLTVRERAGWSTNHRPASTGAWGPLNGVMIHHTVSGDGSGIVDLCYRGRSDLPGPLCHGVVHKDGTITVVGWGRANHAGLGDDDALSAVVNESTSHPRPNERNTDGNARFVGFECVNRGDGTDPWPAAQLAAIAKAAAAVCRFYGWGPHSVIGHLEWTNQKVDPRGFSMASMRDRIGRLLTAPPGGAVPPIVTQPQEDDMPITDADARKVWTLDFVKAPVTDPANPTWAPSSYLRDTNVRVRAMQATLAAQGATIQQLAKTVADLSAGVGDIDSDTLIARIEAAIEGVTIHLDVPGSPAS